VKTYRQLFAVSQLGALFVVVSTRLAAQTMSGLALSTLIYGRTGSPILSALSMFGASFAQMIGAATLLSIADRVAPRAGLITIGVVFGAATLALAIPGVPVWALLAIELSSGLVAAAGGGIQWGLVHEIVPADSYVLGRSVFNIASGVMQIVGFAIGGVLVVLVSARGALLLAAGLYIASSSLARLGLTRRPARTAGRASVRVTLAVNARLWSSGSRRGIYLALWVPNGLIVGCEALYVPYASRWAAILFVAAGAGMLTGDIAVGRFVPERWRGRLIGPLRLLLAAPYLLFDAHLAPTLAVLTVAVASIGYGAGLLLQERLIAHTPSEIRGQGLGLHSAGMLSMQAVGATLAGMIAQWTNPATAITIMATASLVITIALTPHLRPLPRLQSTENSDAEHETAAVGRV
jgi:MFS family permease